MVSVSDVPYFMYIKRSRKTVNSNFGLNKYFTLRNIFLNFIYQEITLYGLEKILVV